MLVAVIECFNNIIMGAENRQHFLSYESNTKQTHRRKAPYKATPTVSLTFCEILEKRDQESDLQNEAQQNGNRTIKNLNTRDSDWKNKEREKRAPVLAEISRKRL